MRGRGERERDGGKEGWRGGEEGMDSREWSSRPSGKREMMEKHL